MPSDGTNEATLTSPAPGRWIVTTANFIREYERYRSAKLAARRYIAEQGGGEVTIHTRGGLVLTEQVPAQAATS